MSFKKKLSSFIEWTIALILVATCIYFYLFSYGSFNAIDAFKASEKSFNYGPSQIKEEINLKNGKIYLAKYKDWISACIIEKKFIKWYPGSGVGGSPINYSDKVSSNWSGSRIGDKSFIYTVFGYVNDSTIATVNLKVKEKEKENTMTYNIDLDKTFIFYWDDNEHKNTLISLNGLDRDGRTVYEYKYPH
jgi:hypothetical protein